MKKTFVVLSLVLLSGCSVSKNDPIIGHWSEEGQICGNKPFCAFTVAPASGMSSKYSIKFDKTPTDYPNTGVIEPKWGGVEGVYSFTNPDIFKAHPNAKGVVMYLDKGTLVETSHGTRFKKDVQN